MVEKKNLKWRSGNVLWMLVGWMDGPTSAYFSFSFGAALWKIWKGGGLDFLFIENHRRVLPFSELGKTFVFSFIDDCPPFLFLNHPPIFFISDRFSPCRN